MAAVQVASFAAAACGRADVRADEAVFASFVLLG
jgi:hypothetical protein